MSMKTKDAESLRYKRGISFNIYLPVSELYLKEELEELAEKERRSVSDYVIGVLRDHVDNKKKK